DRLHTKCERERFGFRKQYRKPFSEPKPNCKSQRKRRRPADGRSHPGRRGGGTYAAGQRF
ncbi:MAG TPA: hypothetical protein VNT24_03710, partial [Propionibacteriaceae bacterium]|nr:hypothetical protein [Propionibacteriaceae bacterium]